MHTLLRQLCRLLPLAALACWLAPAQAETFVKDHFYYETVDSYNARIKKNEGQEALKDFPSSEATTSVVIIGSAKNANGDGCRPASEESKQGEAFCKDANHYTFKGTATCPPP